jgi:hypothetical protein
MMPAFQFKILMMEKVMCESALGGKYARNSIFVQFCFIFLVAFIKKRNSCNLGRRVAGVQKHTMRKLHDAKITDYQIKILTNMIFFNVN